MPTLLFTLKDYLNTQKQLQFSQKTSINVPSVEELAEACGMKLTPFSRMINNKTDGISRAKIAMVVAYLKFRGLNPTFSDLFSYHE